MIVVVLCLVVLFFNVIREHGISNSTINFEHGWSVEAHDSVYHVATISERKLPFRVLAGDTLIFENTLPKMLPEHPVLRFKTSHSAVQVEIDRPVYSFGLDKIKNGSFLGSGYHYITLNASDAGKPLVVRAFVSADDAFGTVPHFEFLPADMALCDYNAVHLVEIAVGLFLVLFGIIAVLSSLVLSIWGKPSYRFSMIGLLSFLLGLWTLCYMKLMQAFSMDFAFNTALEYFALYAGPIPFGILLIDMHKEFGKRWKIVCLKILVICGMLFFMVAAILHATGLVYCNRLLWVFHLYVILEFLFLSIFVLPYKKGAGMSGKLLTWGVALFAVVVFLDLLRYNIFKFFPIKGMLLDTTWIPLGILAFILLLMASYLNYLRDVIAAKAEKDVLAEMVYIDSLTGLYNRAKCGQIFEVLNKNSKNFAVVSLDMNGLKLANDRYGHSVGDSMIKSFAAAFGKSFAGVGTTIRMGGDEFVAFVREEHLSEVEDSLNSLNKLLKNTVGLPLRLEVAYGVAYRNDCPGKTAEEVYQVADKRMYDMKMNMKSELVRK